MEFDMESAVEEVGAGLGFESAETSQTDDVELGVTLPAEDTPETPAIPAAAETPELNPDGTPKASEDPAAADPAASTAPRTWRPEAAAEFGKLPPVVQQEILKREEDIFKGLEQYKQAADFGNSMKTVLDPYMGVLQQYNIRPEAQVQDMMQSHYTLAFGTDEQKMEMVQRVFRDYKLDPGKIFGNLQAENSGEYIDPQVQALQQELQSVKSRLAQDDQARQQARYDTVLQEAQAFAADPKNGYFEELANDIATLLKTGASKTIADAYEKAMWMNPAVRAKELDRTTAEKAEAARKEAEKKAAEARKAKGANVRTRANSGSAAAPVGSMDDTLKETLAKINGQG